jgi:hypothetical protein
MKRRAVQSITGLVVLLTATVGEAGVVTTRCGALGQTVTRTEQATTPMSFTARAFVDIRNASLSLTIPGTARSCIIVTYAAQMQSAAPERLLMRVVLDGSKVAEPGPIVMTADDGEQPLTAHGFTWVFTGVAPGTHVIKVQGSTGHGSVVKVQQQTLIVQSR